MKLRTGIVAAAMLASAALSATPATSQTAPTKDQLVGTWTYVVATNTRPDGTTFRPNGESAKGLLMFDAGGNFSWNIIRTDIPKFAKNTRLEGTADENKASVHGTLSFFGTYAAEGKSVTMTIVASSFPNFTGATQQRMVTLAGDELTIVNQAGASGGTAEVKWRRAK